MINISVIDSVLTELGMKYRRFEVENTVLLFCTLPNGRVYDLSVDKDGCIKLWQFIGDASTSQYDMRIVCRRSEYPCAAVGFEVTDEGNICFYAELKVNFNNPNTAEQIYKLIKGYCEIILNFSIENVLM